MSVLQWSTVLYYSSLYSFSYNIKNATPIILKQAHYSIFDSSHVRNQNMELLKLQKQTKISDMPEIYTIFQEPDRYSFN